MRVINPAYSTDGAVTGKTGIHDASLRVPVRAPHRILMLP
jgi:hypothetical protein